MHKISGLRDPAAAFPLPGVRDDAGERRAANRAEAVSAIGLGATGLVELLLAVLTGSVGLLGDAIHNLSDVSTSAVVFLGFRLSRRPATERYPYGLDRAEDLAGIGIAAVIWASAAFAGYESIRKLLVHAPTTHGAGIAGAVIGIWRQPGRRALQAGCRQAHQVGHAGGRCPAFLVGCAVVGGGAGRAGRRRDGIDPLVITTAESAAGSVPGVLHAHARARWTGRTLRLEIEGWVDPGLPARDADAIGRHVEAVLSQQLPEAGSLTWAARAGPS